MAPSIPAAPPAAPRIRPRQRHGRGGGRRVVIAVGSSFFLLLLLALVGLQARPTHARSSGSGGGSVGGGNWGSSYGSSGGNSGSGGYGMYDYDAYDPYDYDGSVAGSRSGRQQGAGPSSSLTPPPAGGRRRPPLTGSGAARGRRGRRGAGLGDFDYDYDDDEDAFVDGDGNGAAAGGVGPEGGGGSKAAAVDPVDLYCSRAAGKLAVTLAAGVVGTGLGMAVSASIFHKPATFALGGACVGLLLSLMRNDFGDLFRALGLMLIYLLERNQQAGNQYSALRQLRPMLRLAQRRPFPPVENPWAYVRASPADVEFSMTKSLVAITFIGAFIGYLVSNAVNLFFLPVWLLALSGGGLFGYTATLRDGRGDMARVLGMKVVAFVSLLRALDEELSVLGKTGKVFHISYGHAARFDRRFKIREKVWALAGWVSSKLNKEAQRVRSDMGGDPSAPPFNDLPQPTYRDMGDGYGGGGGGRRGYDPSPPSGSGSGRPPPYNPQYGR